MIYTVGDKQEYEKAFNSENIHQVTKIGRKDGYGGGLAFETAAEAQAYIANPIYVNYAVYGLDCGIENTYICSISKHRYIIRETKVIQLNEPNEPK